MSELPGPGMAASGILPVHNEARVLARVLDAIDAQRVRLEELIVVLDRCTDGSEEVAKGRAGPVVRVDRGNTASAVMAGVAHARNEVIVLFDGNTLVPPEYVGRILAELTSRGADVVEWHGGLMALTKGTLRRFGSFSTRYLWTLEYFLRVDALGGTLVRLDGPHVRLKRSPLSRNLRYGSDYAELSERYGLAPYFRVGTKSGWIADFAALAGTVLGHVRRGRFLHSLPRAISYVRAASSDRRNQATQWSPK